MIKVNQELVKRENQELLLIKVIKESRVIKVIKMIKDKKENHQLKRVRKVKHQPIRVIKDKKVK